MKRRQKKSKKRIGAKRPRKTGPKKPVFIAEEEKAESIRPRLTSRELTLVCDCLEAGMAEDGSVVASPAEREEIRQLHRQLKRLEKKTHGPK